MLGEAGAEDGSAQGIEAFETHGYHSAGQIGCTGKADQGVAAPLAREPEQGLISFGNLLRGRFGSDEKGAAPLRSNRRLAE